MGWSHAGKKSAPFHDLPDLYLGHPKEYGQRQKEELAAMDLGEFIGVVAQENLGRGARWRVKIQHGIHALALEVQAERVAGQDPRPDRANSRAR